MSIKVEYANRSKESTVSNLSIVRPLYIATESNNPIKITKTDFSIFILINLIVINVFQAINDFK